MASIRMKMANKEVEVDLSTNTLTQSTVKSQFLLAPEAVVSLSYEVNGRRKGCDSSSKCSHSASNSNEPSLPPDPAPTAEAVINWMFFLYDDIGKATVICLHSRYLVTFRHGPHLQFKIGDTLKIYKVEKKINEEVRIDVCVIKVNEGLDFVLLKSESDVAEHGPSIARARKSEPFTLAGFDNTQGSLSYLPGTIHSVRDFYLTFEGNVQQKGPFILGTHRSSRGGGIWGSRGLIGMNVACTTMPLQFHRLTTSEQLLSVPRTSFLRLFGSSTRIWRNLTKNC
ncbi:hypothetical protein M3Y98_00618800 [Aphelenchoides besseyi]|nr:hypothetical protein M3Y98_00618800 [Aphelenchoides besseyi]KAI6208358.1 hypothetical protein M3Y96_00106800 [Aphelenchoides besseyi]